MGINYGGYREGSGRPQVEEIRKPRSFKATEAEWQAIKELAKSKGFKSASDYIRTVALKN